MNEYKSLKTKKNSSFGIVLAVLILLELCASVMLGMRLIGFSAQRSANIFSLTESSARTNVRVGYRDEDGTVTFPEEQMMLTRPRASLTVGGFRYANQEQKEDKVWAAFSDVEIFKTSYANGEGIVTVDGGKDKVIAPGTENTYTFTLQNSGAVALDYMLNLDAFFGGGIEELPILVRVRKNDGDFLLGGQDTYVDLVQLNTVSEVGVLGAGRYQTYHLDWKWEFEGDDAYDTLLGNLSISGEQSLDITISTVAEAAPDPDHSGGDITPPQTGDDFSFFWWLLVALLAFVGIWYAVDSRKREEY